jgi:hypothetical protein
MAKFMPENMEGTRVVKKPIACGHEEEYQQAYRQYTVVGNSSP